VVGDLIASKIVKHSAKLKDNERAVKVMSGHEVQR
jgi:hypothetical protein